MAENKLHFQENKLIGEDDVRILFRETLKKFGRLTRIYKSLKPYIKKAVSQNANEGTPGKLGNQN